MDFEFQTIPDDPDAVFGSDWRVLLRSLKELSLRSAHWCGVKDLGDFAPRTVPKLGGCRPSGVVHSHNSQKL